ncbi:MAG: type II/IV secretion system protein [Phycisphaerae bacterium]|nr:type II/IV secretion system protein [Phycisphaerae bacterium]
MDPVFNVEKLIRPDADPVLVWESIVDAAAVNLVSDIHLTAQRDGHDLAFRIDGDMRPQGRMGRDFARRLIQHVKSVSGIDVAESRRPTEGRLKLSIADRTIDLRVSIVPTLYGQDMVVRIFDSTVSLMSVTELGLRTEQLNHLRDMIGRPSGLVLVAGPSGGGKTTTLYAVLRDLTARHRKIVTIEDPIEYDLDGINQTQVNPRIDVTFARLLTALLRQDPDIVMVGEVRDRETAVTAVRAANTGHLVLATTHAIRASRAIETMLSLGTHPYFLSVALRAVIAQVLVKRVCPHCKTPLPETGDIVLDDAVRDRLPEGTEPRLYQGTGCEACRGTGYSGRMGLFEMFIPDDKIKNLILQKRGAAAIDDAARHRGMLSLEQAGKLAAVLGQTTMEQVVDVLPNV